MTAYRNFSVQFPERIKELDQDFKALATERDLQVTYLMMKASSCFLLPFERLAGTSGASSAEIPCQQKIRRHLDLDKPFAKSSYFDEEGRWAKGDVDNFSSGPEGWVGKELWVLPVTAVASCKVLGALRHSLAHSNFFFGGEEQIEDIYFGSKRENKESTEKYTVYRCSIVSLNYLLDSWIENVASEAVSSKLIWQELDQVA